MATPRGCTPPCGCISPRGPRAPQRPVAVLGAVPLPLSPCRIPRRLDWAGPPAAVHFPPAIPAPDDGTATCKPVALSSVVFFKVFSSPCQSRQDARLPWRRPVKIPRSALIIDSAQRGALPRAAARRRGEASAHSCHSHRPPPPQAGPRAAGLPSGRRSGRPPMSRPQGAVPARPRVCGPFPTASAPWR